jgi:WD40 repeat protein
MTLKPMQTYQGQAATLPDRLGLSRAATPAEHSQLSTGDDSESVPSEGAEYVRYEEDAAICKSSRTIVVGGGGGAVVWAKFDLAQGSIKCVRRVQMPEKGVGDIAYSNDGRVVSVGCWDGRVRVYHCRTGKRLAVLKQHRESVASLVYGARGTMACGSRDGTISLWNLYSEV